MNKKINLSELNEHLEMIRIVLGKWLGIIDQEYGLIRLSLNQKLQSFIINKSIIYAFEINSDDNKIRGFEDCYLSKEINNISFYEIPEILKQVLLEQIKIVIDNYKNKDGIEKFYINPVKHTGRLRMLENSIKYQIKLLYKQYVKNINENNLPIGLKFLSFEREIEYKLDFIINNSIKYVICLENNDNDSCMCKEVFSMDYIGEDRYEYTLEKHRKKLMKKYTENFLASFLNKEMDSDILDFHDSKEALLRTMRYAKNEIETIFSMKLYCDNKECILLYNEYLMLFEQSENRIGYSPTLKSFKNMLKKAKMNYIMKHKEEYVYPFLYDLVVMSFSLLMKTTVYKEALSDSSSIVQKIDEFKDMYIDKDADESYLHQDFLQLAKILPKGFNDYTTLIIKHYSEVLDTEYKYIANIFRQLRFSVADDNKGIYRLDKELENRKLSIDEDYFRLWSLDII